MPQASVPWDLWRAETELWQQGLNAVAGTDEAGRGPLAGPVVAACVVLPPPAHPLHDQARVRLVGLTDSKQLSQARREAFFAIIPEVALAWAIAQATPAEIDRMNILRASQEAMARAVRRVRRTLRPEHLLVDGHLVVPGLRGPQTALVKGDSRSISIAAASVLAKVHRDRLCQELHARYPAWGFDRHKGYPTAEHLAAIARHGLTAEHRRSFAPCRRLTLPDA